MSGITKIKLTPDEAAVLGDILNWELRKYEGLTVDHRESMRLRTVDIIYQKLKK